MSGPIDQGQTYRYRFPVKNASGVLANAGSVTVTITLPDLTTTPATVVTTGTGLYDIAYTTSQVGNHNIRAVATGGTLGTEVDVWEDAFVVEQPNRIFIGLDEVSDHLRATGVVSTDPDREQLRRYCRIACGVAERSLGIIVARRSVVETYNGGGSSISLRSIPVISITSVVEDGVTLLGTDYLLNVSEGLLLRGTSTVPWFFSSGRQNVVVTYQAGYSNPPMEIRKYAWNIVQGMWQTAQQASHPLINEEFAAQLLPGSLAGLTSDERDALRSYKNLAGFA